MGARAKNDGPPMAWRRTLTGLEPANDRSREWWKSLKLGDMVAVDGRKPRTIKHHAKFFTLLKIVQDNSEDFDSVEQVLYAVKAALGRGQWIRPAGARRELFIPESISFGSMDQTEFERFYSDAVNAIVKHFLPGVPAEQLDAIVMEY